MPNNDFTVVPEAGAPQPLPFGPGWPKFIGHDRVADRLMPIVRAAFVNFSLVLVAANGEVAAGGWGVPLHWDGSIEDLPEGWDGALDRAVAGIDCGQPANTFCAMATEVMEPWQGQHLSRQILEALRDNAHRRGMKKMIAPARPTLKARYPLTPIDRYAAWQRDDGSPFDPWLRVHVGLGARILVAAPLSMEIGGTVKEWETWAAMEFPESGDYVVPDALSVLKVDRKLDRATYIEPAIWVRHPDAR